MTKIIEGENLIVIDGIRSEVDEIFEYGYLPQLDTNQGQYIVAESREKAGQAARFYWKELAESDPAEFTCLVGEKNLVAWALGQSAGPGSTAVNSLEEWLDLHLDCPEEEFASYDGAECNIDAVTQDIAEDLGWHVEIEDGEGFLDFAAVAYRRG